MGVVRNKDLGPQLHSTAFDKVARLMLEHRVIVRDLNELIVAEALRVRDERKVGVSFLAVLSNNQWLVNLVVG
jgi:hypothetical protein